MAGSAIFEPVRYRLKHSALEMAFRRTRATRARCRRWVWITDDSCRGRLTRAPVKRDALFSETKTVHRYLLPETLLSVLGLESCLGGAEDRF